MKKYKIVSLVLSLTLLLTACGSKKEENKPSNVETPVVETTNTSEETPAEETPAEETSADTQIETETDPETTAQIDESLTYLAEANYQTKSPVFIKGINTRMPESKEIYDYLATFADKVRKGDPSFLDYLAWPEDYKDKEEFARIKIASILNDKDAKELWLQVFKDFKVIESFETNAFNISGNKEEMGKTRVKAFTINGVNENFFNVLSEKEFEDFVKNHPYREYNTSDKEKLLPIYKDLLNKAIKYYPLTIDGRPLDLGDFNKDGNAYINGNQFIGSNVFDFPVSIDESTKKAYWDFNSLEATSEFIPFKLDAQADKDLIQYRDLYNQGKLNDLYSLILKNSQAKGYSFSEDSTLRESITTVESHYKKLGILPSATVTTFADSYKSGDKEKEARAVIKVYGLEARSYIPNGPKEIVQFLPYYYYGGLDYTRPENGKAAEEASIEAVFMEILEALELDSSRQTQVVTEIKTR